MAGKGRKLEKVVYEEKPECGRCGAGIVGVVPRWYDGKPLCRECTFELEQLSLKPGGRTIDTEEAKAPPTAEEITRRNVLIGVLVLIVLVLLFRIYSLAPILQSPAPLRLGVTDTDSLTDKCIAQLWVLSRDLQNKDLPDVLPLCPKSSRQYIVSDLPDDTVINCPTPGEHGLAKLSVSLSMPIPNAVAREEK